MKLKKCYKYMLVMAMTMIMALGLTACGFSVGTPSESTDYKDLFPDAAANLDGSYKTSNLSYRFTVDGEYGFFASNGDACDSTMITILLVDGDGYITGVMTDYMEAIAENETKNGSVDVYGDESMLSQTKDIAIFANSVKPN